MFVVNNVTLQHVVRTLQHVCQKQNILTKVLTHSALGAREKGLPSDKGKN
jgi:hypothetical protein